MISSEKKDAFQKAYQTALSAGRAEGIGTYKEKVLHNALKWYFDPSGKSHEQPHQKYVADVFSDNAFFEIQTRSFYKIKDKLLCFLEDGQVTVVYPVASEKYLVWVRDDGTVTTPRKSPKKAGPWEIFKELYSIRQLLQNENLSFCIMLFSLEEYRRQDGWGNNGKRGSHRIDGLPRELLDEVWIRSLQDYNQLIPDNLPESFTVKDFSKAGRVPQKTAACAVGILRHLGIIEQVGKQGKAYVYRICCKG